MRSLANPILMFLASLGLLGSPLGSFATTPEDTPAVLSAPGNGVAREKLVFLFHHRPDWNRERFQRHYVDIHAPLGLKYSRNLLGYTVNLVRSPSHWDAITEQWVPYKEAILDRRENSASPEDFKKVVGDVISDGHGTTYVVEETVVRGEPISTPLFHPTPGIKVVWLYTDANRVPPPPAWAYRVVDNRVVSRLDIADPTQNVWWKEVPPDIALIRTAWAHDSSALRRLNGERTALMVTEYRFRASPWK